MQLLRLLWVCVVSVAVGSDLSADAVQEQLQLRGMPTVGSPGALLRQLEAAQALEAEAMREAIGQSRGEREEDGTREEWDTKDHIGDSYNSAPSRGLLSLSKAQLTVVLRDNGGECRDCSKADMVRKLAQIAARQGVDKTPGTNKNFSDGQALLVGLATLLTCVFGKYYYDLKTSPAAAPVKSKQELVEEEQRRQQALTDERGALKAAPPPPDNTSVQAREELTWTARQEKQYKTGMSTYGMVGNPKEKWRMVAQGVDGRDAGQCRNHFKFANFKKV